MISERMKLSARLEDCVEDLLSALDFDLGECILTDKNVRGTSLCHEDADNPTAFTYYYDKGTWCCWTHQCHRKHGWDLIGLIIAILKCELKDAVEFANKILEGKDIDYDPSRNLARQTVSRDYWKEHLEQKQFDPICLDYLHSPDGYAKKRGFNKKIVNQWGVGIANSGKMRNRIVIPIRNINGGLVGFTGRKLADEQFGPKWFHHGFKKEINLFNIDKASYDINNSWIIICEGPWDVLKLNMAGYNNAVAIFGNSLCRGQIDILNRCNVTEVCIGLDNDDAGQKGKSSIIQSLKRSLFGVSVATPTEKDFGKMRLDKISSCINDRIYV